MDGDTGGAVRAEELDDCNHQSESHCLSDGQVLLSFQWKTKTTLDDYLVKGEGPILSLVTFKGSRTRAECPRWQT